MLFEMYLAKRQLNRFNKHDYSLPGYYYVTICSKDREYIFTVNGNDQLGTGLAPVCRFELSKLGQIIDHQWNDIKKRYNHVNLDKYVIMPNHIHGILIINKRTGASPVPTYQI